MGSSDPLPLSEPSDPSEPYVNAAVNDTSGTTVLTDEPLSTESEEVDVTLKIENIAVVTDISIKTNGDLTVTSISVLDENEEKEVNLPDEVCFCPYLYK